MERINHRQTELGVDTNKENVSQFQIIILDSYGYEKK